MALDAICEVEGCSKTRRYRRYCGAHYMRVRRFGDVLPDTPMRRAPARHCEVPGCDRDHLARGVCYTHYKQWEHHGFSPDRRPHLKGTARYRDANGYIFWTERGHQAAEPSGRVLEHRAVMAEVLGRPLLPGENVHHKNGDRADNRPENLELWVTLQPSGQRPEDLPAAGGLGGIRPRDHRPLRLTVVTERINRGRLL